MMLVLVVMVVMVVLLVVRMVWWCGDGCAGGTVLVG